jgi:phage terminase large subunit
VPEQRIATGYQAREQFKPFHARTQRWAIGVAHRRAGKTVCCVNDLIDAAIRLKRPFPHGRFGYIAPFRAQAQDAAWSYLKHYTSKIPGVEIRESDLAVILPHNGARVRLYGGDNPDNLRGGYFDGVVLDEYAQMRSGLWSEVILPALSDYKGWAAFIGTANGRDEFCRMYEDGKTNPEWFTFMLKASETGILAPEELAMQRKLQSEDEYNQEYECSFDAAVKGAYYAKLMTQAEADGRIRPVHHDPMAQVETWWDLGHHDATAIWWAQRVGNEIRLIDFYQMTGMTLPHFVNIVKTKQQERGFVYRRHIVGFDIMNVEWAGDGKTRQGVARGLGIEFEAAPDQSIEDGINAVRVTLPRCVFDSARCADGIEALRSYRAQYDDKLDVLRPKPLHDKYSDAADAFRYGCITDAPVETWDKPLKYRSSGIR